jgi:hypothetical protein
MATRAKSKGGVPLKDSLWYEATATSLGVSNHRKRKPLPATGGDEVRPNKSPRYQNQSTKAIGG